METDAEKPKEKERNAMGLWADAKNIRDKDPAARNTLEVVLLYPGFHVLSRTALHIFCTGTGCCSWRGWSASFHAT